MSAIERAFIDTNVLLYLLSADAAKADRAEQVVADGGVISVQVLNEFASVATRKLGLTLEEAREALIALRANCEVVPLTADTHDLGLVLAGAHRLSVYDAMIVAVALLADCRVLLSEDMQSGQRIERLTIRNPFR
jgi:predicted nucleic acid-binding protein